MDMTDDRLLRKVCRITKPVCSPWAIFKNVELISPLLKDYALHHFDVGIQRCDILYILSNHHQLFLDLVIFKILLILPLLLCSSIHRQQIAKWETSLTFSPRTSMLRPLLVSVAGFGDDR